MKNHFYAVARAMFASILLTTIGGCDEELFEDEGQFESEEVELRKSETKEIKEPPPTIDDDGCIFKPAPWAGSLACPAKQMLYCPTEMPELNCWHPIQKDCYCQPLEPEQLTPL